MVTIAGVTNTGTTKTTYLETIEKLLATIDRCLKSTIVLRQLIVLI